MMNESWWMNHDEDESWFLEICFCANFLYACTAFLTLCHEASSFVLCADANIFLSLYYQNSSNVTRSLTAANITRQLRNISSMLNTCDLFHPFCLFGCSDESVLFFDLLLFLGILVNVWHDWYGTTKISYQPGCHTRYLGGARSVSISWLLLARELTLGSCSL